MDKFDFSLIGSRIRQVRKAQGYTQEKIAEMINISTKNFSQLECGKMGVSVATLAALCKALDVSADYVLFGLENGRQDGTIGILLSELSEKEQLYAEKILSAYVDSCKNRD